VRRSVSEFCIRPVRGPLLVEKRLTAPRELGYTVGRMWGRLQTGIPRWAPIVLTVACGSGIDIAPPVDDDDTDSSPMDAGAKNDGDGPSKDASVDDEPMPTKTTPSPGPDMKPSAPSGSSDAPSAEPIDSGKDILDGLFGDDGGATKPAPSPVRTEPVPPSGGGTGGAAGAGGESGSGGAGGTDDWPMGGASGSSGATGGAAGEMGSAGSGGTPPDPKPPFSGSNEVLVKEEGVRAESGCPDYPLGKPVFFRFRLEEYEANYTSMNVLSDAFAPYISTDLTVGSSDGGATWPEWMSVEISVAKSVRVQVVDQVDLPVTYADTLVVSRVSDGCPVLVVPLQIDLE